MVSSENGRTGMIAAMDLLRRGGRALDAVELACRITEDDPNDHSVGYSGIPNVAGEVELDASIMDGRTLRTGAVAGLRGYGNPIVLARKVMEETPHVLVVGQGAVTLAVELGMTPQEQLTDAALQIWRERFTERGIQPGSRADLRNVAHELTRPVPLKDQGVAPAGGARTGTVNFLARDRYGDLASAVSTSGLAWKYPGRVGDSPIIGAGNYCDNRWGAAACTGMGELAIRVSTARSIVLYMRFGMSPREAGLAALKDLDELQDEIQPAYRMNMVLLTPAGEHLGFTSMPEKRLYLYMTGDMDAPCSAERIGRPTA
jgi:beta-aspartyl-peptidase (threonine type)